MSLAVDVAGSAGGQTSLGRAQGGGSAESIVGGDALRRGEANDCEERDGALHLDAWLEILLSCSVIVSFLCMLSLSMKK